MSSGPRWGISAPRLRLALCAIGVHKFYYMSAGKDAGRDTLRECYACGRTQDRVRHGNFSVGPWSNVR